MGFLIRLGLDLSLHDNKVTIFLLPSLVVFTAVVNPC